MLRFTLFTADGPTRLNSTLSIRIEELNAQISALHVENLRLRSSEIALGTQLKKEREKSQRIITDAESAVRFHPFYSPLFFTSNVLLLTCWRNSDPIPLMVILFPTLATSLLHSPWAL